jgi:predicted dehydrogenase
LTLSIEKPVTSNLAELRSLVEIARENNVFFMEGKCDTGLSVRGC